MNLVERLEEAFEKRVGETAMLPASDVLSAIIEIQRLQAELAERKLDIDSLMQDSERLIWICDNFFVSQWNGVIDSGSRTHWRIAGDYRHTAAKMEGFYFREAIDSAIAAQKGEVK